MSSMIQCAESLNKNDASTLQLRLNTIYDTLMRRCFECGINDATAFQLFVNYVQGCIGGGGGGSGLNAGGFGYFSFGSITLSNPSPVFPEATIVPGYDIEQTNATTLSWPNLASVDPSNLQGGYFQVSNNDFLTTVSLPNLNSVAGPFKINANKLIVTVSLPKLTSVGSFDCDSNNLLTTLTLPLLTTTAFSASGNNVLTSLSLPSFASTSTILSCQNCPALNTVTLAVLLPHNGDTVSFNGSALFAASVNHVLARCVASAGYVTGTVDLSGGTNAAPSGQGIADKATLIGRGVTVNTN